MADFCHFVEFFGVSWEGKMVRLSEESSNLLFETLAEWTEILKTTSLGRRMNDNIPPKPAQSRAKKKR